MINLHMSSARFERPPGNFHKLTCKFEMYVIISLNSSTWLKNKVTKVLCNFQSPTNYTELFLTWYKYCNMLQMARRLNLTFIWLKIWKSSIIKENRNNLSDHEWIEPYLPSYFDLEWLKLPQCPHAQHILSERDEKYIPVRTCRYDIFADIHPERAEVYTTDEV